MIRSPSNEKKLSMIWNRRKLLQNLTALGCLTPFAGGFWLPGSRARAQNGTPRRLLQIFLAGGWDSALATDPVIGSKKSEGNYQPDYQGRQVKTVPGKDNLIVGEGLIPAISAFQKAPTAFVNGMFVEVTAHDLAAKYVLSGRLSLTRGVEYPAAIALAAEAAGHFPSHVVFGQVPLGDTKKTAPPLISHGVQGLAEVLTGFGSRGFLTQATVDAIDETILALNDGRYGSGEDKDRLTAWNEAERRLPELYAKEYQKALTVSDELKSRYEITEDLSPASQVAGAYLVLKSGITPFVTIFWPDFDTHSFGLDVHVANMHHGTKALPTLIDDLQNTADPDDPSLSLADTTTILVTSEFVRTPKFNLEGGTDHWQSASAILMGSGVRDNTVFGATNDAANALGWIAGAPVPATKDTYLLPDHLMAALLRSLGFEAAADTISKKVLSGILS